MEVKYQVLVLFRVLQRCRGMEDWPAYKAAFLEGIRKVIMQEQKEPDEEGLEDRDPGGVGKDSTDSAHESDPPTPPPGQRRKKQITMSPEQKKQLQCEFLEAYFERNWFTERWLRA
jgi:hypothetical protein